MNARIKIVITFLMGIGAFYSLAAQTGNDNERHIDEPYINTVTANAHVHKARKGIMIIGDSGSVIAASPFGYNSVRLKDYASVANSYKETFGPNVNIYCMPIPLSSAYYTPDSALSWTSDQRNAINKLFAALNKSVQPVNIFTTLGQHASEHIYSRTDHHWAPLGAYYAAQHFAEVAQVPFLDLSHYDTVVHHDYIGTMFMYSKDSLVIKSPEDFVYYVPRDIEYTTYYVNLKIDKRHKNAITEGTEYTGRFFIPTFTGASSYCVFGGGDYKIIRVETSTNNGRRLLILKDSFGNALTGYLLASFEQIHVIDCRYFKRNLKKYVEQYNITDILFANNISHASMEVTCNSYRKYLIQ